MPASLASSRRTIREALYEIFSEPQRQGLPSIRGSVVDRIVPKQLPCSPLPLTMGNGAARLDVSL
jgi:hypothetical protein